MIEGLQLNIPRRMILVRIVLTFSLVISVLLSFNLWAGARSFPYAPAMGVFEYQLPLDYVVIILTLLLWIGSLFFQWHRLLIFSAVALSVLLVMCDLNRLQP